MMDHGTATFKILAATSGCMAVEYKCIDDNDQPVTIIVYDVVEEGNLINIVVDYSMAKKRKRPNNNNVILKFGCWPPPVPNTCGH